MNAKLGQHLILLGLCDLIFYMAMLLSGKLPLEAIPQFFTSAVIFIGSGYFMRKSAQATVHNADNCVIKVKEKRKELDGPWLTALLNWFAAFIIIGVMALVMLKPIGVSFRDELKTNTNLDRQYFSHFVP